MDNRFFTEHSSTKFNEELEAIRTTTLEMGGLVSHQLSTALKAFQTKDSNLAQEVIEQELKVNQFAVDIDQRCLEVIARRAPAAGDLRMVMVCLKMSTDIERIGDEIAKMANMAIKLLETSSISLGQHEVKSIGHMVNEMLSNVLDSFARIDSTTYESIRESEAEVDQAYGSAVRSTITYMMEDPRSISSAMNLMWTLRSLERIGDHIENIAEHVIYLVEGKDVRLEV